MPSPDPDKGHRPVRAQPASRFSRSVLAYLLLLVAALGVALLITHAAAQNRMQAAVARTIGEDRPRIAVLAHHGGDMIQGRMDLLQSFATGDAARHALDAPAGAAVPLRDALLAIAGHDPDVAGIGWIDDTGRERVRIEGGPEGPRSVPDDVLGDLSNRPGMGEALARAPGRAFVWHVNPGRQDASAGPSVRLGLKAIDSTGADRGVLFLDLSLARLLDLIDGAGPAGTALLLETDGGPVAVGGASVSRLPPDAAVWSAIAARDSGGLRDAGGNLWLWDRVGDGVPGPRPAAEAGTPHLTVVGLTPRAVFDAPARAVWRTLGPAAVGIALGLWGVVSRLIAVGNRLSRQAEVQAETQRRLVQETRARVAREQTERLFESNLAGMALLDGSGRILRINPALGRMLGHSPGDLAGTSFGEIVIGFDLPDPEPGQTGPDAPGDAVPAPRIARALRAEGPPIPVEITISCLPGDAGDLVAATIQDISARLDGEQRLAEALRDARRISDRMNRIADSIPGAIFEHREGAGGEVTIPYFSARLPGLLGVPAEIIRRDGAAAVVHIHPDDAAPLAEAIRRSRDRLCPLEYWYRLNHPDKGLRWMFLCSSPVRQPDGAVIWFGNVTDITEMVEAEQRARAAAEEARLAHGRLASIAEVVPVGLFEVRMLPDGTFDHSYVNDRFCTLVGYGRDEVAALTNGLYDRIHPEDVARVRASLEQSHLDGSLRDARFRLCHPDRGTVWMTRVAIAREEEDGTRVWTGAMLDVTEEVRREEDLEAARDLAERMRAENEHQSLHDGLTGLPNRRSYDRAFADRVEAARTGQGGGNAVLVRIELDHFKDVNDTLGHEAGDEVLRRVGAILRDATGPGDFAARIGGDEFAILLAPARPVAAAEALIERIRARLAEPVTYNGSQCRFAVSCGIAPTDDIAGTGRDLQYFADAALARARARGRDRVEVFTEADHRDLLADRGLAQELQDGLERDEFLPHFQPQIRAADGSLAGVEALLRWNHPEKGLLLPGAFMHVAEKLRLVPDLDRVMVRKSRAALERCRRQGLSVPKVSFNVTSEQMENPGVLDLAREAAIEGTQITFELLESILFEEETEDFRRHLALLRQSGIDIEIDDFGSGHASLLGLMAISPSALKIDRRIVEPIIRDVTSQKLVAGIVEIASPLGIGVVAEGVETAEHARLLCELGCGVLQGFHFSRPLAEDDLLRYGLDLAASRAAPPRRSAI